MINQKAVAKNTLMLYIRMGAMMLVSLYTSRVILATLGINDFGIYNVVGGVVVMFSFINLTLTTSIRRFLAYELGKETGSNIQSVFNSSVIAVFFTAVIIVIALETIGIWFLNNQLNIPDERMDAANFAFQFSILSFFFSMNAVPYSSAIVAYERMGVYAYIGVIDVVLKLLLVLLLQYLPGDKLKIFCVLTFCLSLFTTLFNFFYCKFRIIDTTSIIPFKVSNVIEIFKFSSWSVLGSLVFMMANQGISMIYNVFFGVAINAAFGVSQQVNNAFNQFVGNFQTAFNPQLTKSYSSEGLSENTFRFVCQMSKLTILLILVIGVPLLSNISLLFDIWLKSVPPYAVKFTIISIIYLSIDWSAGPLYILIYAKGDIKLYQLLLSTIQLSYVVLVVLLCYLGLAPDVVLSASIVNAVLLYLGRFYILRLKFNFPINRYFKYVLRPLILPLGLFVIMTILINITPFYYNNIIWIGTFIRIILFVLLVVWISFRFYLNKEEKAFVLSIINNKLRRYDNKN